MKQSGRIFKTREKDDPVNFKSQSSGDLRGPRLSLGGGMEMILAADITVAATDAKIGIPTISSVGFRDGAVQSFFRERSALPEPRSFYIRGAASLRRKR